MTLTASQDELVESKSSNIHATRLLYFSCNNYTMDKDVEKYLELISDANRKNDMRILLELIVSISNKHPEMWGPSIISFGLYKYKYESGREGEAPKIGISNRKQAIVLYGLHISDNDHPNSKLLEKLGKYKTGKDCLYISELDDIDLEVLKEIIFNASPRPVS